MKPPSGKPLGINFGYRIGAGILMPIMRAITKRTWLGTEKIPKSGAAIFYSNHVSYLDALVLAHYLFENGRAPRFIGKESVFKIPIVGWVLYKAEQIPVKRESNSAAIALAEAIAALKMGHAIGIYPEGTLTRDPNLWPMTGKTGAVRLALASGAPLIPIAQWGDHKILAPYSKSLKLFPAKPITLQCGDPVDLSKWKGKEDDPVAMEEATRYVMQILSQMVGVIRDELPPTEIFDIRKTDLPRTGNFRKKSEAMNKVTVIGAGAWGTTLAQVLSDAGNDVLLWARNESVVNEINNEHSNQQYLSGLQLPLNIKATSDIQAAFAHSDIYVLAIPTQQLRVMLNEWRQYINKNAVVVSTLKGIELTTDLRVSEVVAEIWGDLKFALITGPNLADELALRQLAGAVVASSDLEVAQKIQKLFTTDYYRVYTPSDVMGCELAGAIKSVITLSVGMAIGMGYGENTQSMLITRGLNEIARMCAAHGSDPLTAASLAGMGDLVASCGSSLSRNRTFGEVLGQTQSMEAARTRVAKTVEGVPTSRAALELAHRVGVEVPIIEAVADVVTEAISPRDAFKRIMEISTKAEGFD